MMRGDGEFDLADHRVDLGEGLPRRLADFLRDRVGQCRTPFLENLCIGTQAVLPFGQGGA